MWGTLVRLNSYCHGPRKGPKPECCGTPSAGGPPAEAVRPRSPGDKDLPLIKRPLKSQLSQ